MPLVKNGVVIEDHFVRILDEAAAPDEGHVIVPATRLLADAGELTHRIGLTGVLWPNDRSIADLAPYLDRLALVVLTFPSFRDGRAYSQARLLRERYHFRGEIRAAGQVLRDQLGLMHRAGFDAFEVSKAADAEKFSDAIARYSVVYQPDSAGRFAVPRRRSSGSHTTATQGAVREHDAH